MTRRRSALLAVVFLAAWLTPVRASGSPAGPATAVVTGKITALNGSVRLPGVVVVLTTLDGAAVGEVVTDEQGQYRIVAPRAGTYRLKAVIEGFHPGGQEAELSDRAPRVVDLDLKLIAIEQTVDVTPTADTPMDLAKPLSPVQSIDGRTLSASAMSSGSVASALRWLPGVSPYGREWAIKGGRPNQIGLQIESAQVVDPASGTSPIQLPGDAVSSIQVLANPYSVEFGRFSSGVIVVSTRSGASKWSGTVNNFLPAFILKRGANPFRPTGIGGFDPRVTFGGPIVKQRLLLAQSAQVIYESSDVASRPQSERRESRSLSSFTRLDYIVNTHNTLTGTLTLAPENAGSVTLGTFDPPGVTADLTRRVYRAGLYETAQLPHAMVIESLAHFTRYRSSVDGHGDATEMVLAPDGNSGTYYNRQDRRSTAWQVSTTLSGFVAGLWGEHLIKGGVDVLHADYEGTHDMRPVAILRQDGTLTRRLTTSPSRLTLHATDATAFIQDRWHIADRLLCEFGVRVERDGVFGRVNVAPRFGAAVALDHARNATVRGGWGYFYERTPTLAGAFGQLSDLVEAAYAADGHTPAGSPVAFVHAPGPDPQTPRSVTWNLGYEHRVSTWLAVRLNHLQRDGRHELVLDSRQDGARGWLVLDSSGRSRYRDTEVGAHLKRGDRIDIDVSYTHSASSADLNDAYGFYLNATANPVVRGNQFGPTDTDTPHRFVARGRMLVGRNWSVEAAGEIKSGVPYSAIDEQLDFVGPRNSLRFPAKAVLDAAVERRFRIGRFQPWIGLVFVNALNSFNPVDVQRNVASPAFGGFYNSPFRQIRLTVHIHP